jgi:ferredoxin-NADP reductase/DMSO/TMAO reductase YedYZ heme-binding membrane subunit
MKYIVPVAAIAVLILQYFHGVAWFEVQELFANRWRGLLIFILGIKPISVLLKRYLTPVYRKLPEGISYLVKWWTQDPILIYIKHLIVNTAYSICLYGLKLRKRLGILTFWCILVHRLSLELIRFQQGAPLFIASGSVLVWTGVAGLIALLVWFVTSNMWAMKKLKRRRKPVQQIAYLAFLWACIHLYFVSHSRGYIILFVVFVALKIVEWKKVNPTILHQPAKPVEQIPDWMKAKIINHKLLTHDVLELTIEVHEELKIIPGQRALLVLKDAQWYFNRSYSIVDYDVDEGTTLFVLAIKLVGGRGTTFLSQMKIGAELLVKWIYGKFILQDTDAPKVFIGTWIGIAPLLNMAKYSENKHKKLYFSVREAKDIFYEEKMKEILDLSYEIHTTQEDVPGYMFGRLDIDKADIDPKAEIYVCGNPKVVEVITQELKAKWCQNIFSEKF